MEQPSRLEENLINLSKIMAALKEFRDEVVPKKAKQMALWLENVNTKLEEFDVLKEQINKLNKGGSRTVRTRLNKELLEIQKMVSLLKVLGEELSNTIEALFNDLLERNPKRFSHANLISFTSNFSKGFHSALHGNVFKGHFPNGEQVGVKILERGLDILEPIFMSEINTMFKTSHRNLIKLHGFCFEKNKKALVYEYMPNGSLTEVLSRNQWGEEKIEWEKLYNIAIETGKGLSYLHDGCDEQLIHRDLSASNVHLDSSYSPKITNFGMMKIITRRQKSFKMSRQNGRSYYAAPELFQSRSKVTYKCDVYSFGIILLEILGRRRNFEDNVVKLFYWKKFEEGKVEELLTECGIPDKNTQEAKILCVVAFWCIQLTPESRPSMSTVVKMLEKEIQVISPPNPFVAATSLTKAYREVVYEDEDKSTSLMQSAKKLFKTSFHGALRGMAQPKRSKTIALSSLKSSNALPKKNAYFSALFQFFLVNHALSRQGVVPFLGTILLLFCFGLIVSGPLGLGVLVKIGLRRE